MPSCAHCHDPLELNIDISDDDEDVSMDEGPSGKAKATTKTVPDDVTLPCACHFHWQCLLDAYEITKCPSCYREITSGVQGGSQQLLCDLNNEGGLQEGLDILPLLTEESYLRAYPEDRKCRAFLEFCREGDFHAIVDLLKSCEDDDADDQYPEGQESQGREKTVDEILRYQDFLGEMQSGLHAAVENDHREVAWLLLLLASNLPELEFPALVFQEAGSLGVMRTEQEGLVDIRTLKDREGRTAAEMAAAKDGVWHGWVEKFLTP